MTERHSKKDDLRGPAVLLGVFALLLRCVIAPGVMPDPAAAANGAFKLVICTGFGLQERPWLPDRGPSEPVHQGDQTLCPYAAAGYTATAPDIGPLADVPLRPVYAAAAAPDIARAIPIHIPPARAPPYRV
jgi:Protein of unknown function (DUF2946)